MLYFKNVELSKKYHISLGTVRNWITAAEQGKLDLKLGESNGRKYIVNTTSNTSILEGLTQKGQKFRNTRAYKEIHPAADFYKLYSPKQIFEIISSLNVHHEIPLQYNYLDEGAVDWNKYAERLNSENTSNMLLSCRNLLESNLDSIDRLIGNHKRVNIIDIGIGNCMPVRGIIEHLLKRRLLNRYIGIDISKSMLDIASNNLSNWFGDKVKLEFYERDISHEEFGDLIAPDYLEDDGEIPINIVLLLGGTLANFEVPDDILRTIYRGMQPNDLFITSLKLDTANSRRYFDLDPEPDKPSKVASWHRVVLDLLNIDESLYEVEQVFNTKLKARFIGIKPNIDLSIVFKLNKGEHAIIVKKGEPLLVLRYWHYSAADVMDLLDRSSFEVLQTSRTRGHEYFLVVAETKKTLFSDAYIGN